MLPDPTLKTCTQCGARKSLVDFATDKRWRSGHAASCKSCEATRQRAWYKANTARAQGFKTAWYLANKEHYLATRKRDRIAGGERVLISVLFKRDRGICGICKTKVFKNARDVWMRPSHDHILPVSHGGANTYANSRLVHRRCNSTRGNRGAAQLRLVG